MDKINETVIKIVNMDELQKSGQLIAKTGDKNGRDLYVQLEDKGGKAEHIEDARLTLAYKTPSGVINEIAFTQVKEVDGLYKLTYDDGLTHEAGVVTATIRVKTYDATTETPNFDIYVEGSPLEGIHFSEVDGLTFKKVMDRVDEIELRSKFIEEDLLHIDEQIQDMNTRIIFVEEDDSLDERIYNNENDIVLINEEVERISTELEELKEEVANIEVGGGSGGTPTNEKDTGWRVVMDVGQGYYSKLDGKLYVRRLGNFVELTGYIKNITDKEVIDRFAYRSLQSEDKYYGYPDMFYPKKGTDYVELIQKSRELGQGVVLVQDAHIAFNTYGVRQCWIYVPKKEDNSYRNISGKFYTDEPFTNEYMDLPLADFN